MNVASACIGKHCHCIVVALSWEASFDRQGPTAWGTPALTCVQELEARDKFLNALAEKYSVGGIPEPGPMPEQPPLPEDEAIILIQANERGRQAREKAQTMRTFKRQRQLEDRRARSGVVRCCCQPVPACAA